MDALLVNGPFLQIPVATGICEIKEPQDTVIPCRNPSWVEKEKLFKVELCNVRSLFNKLHLIDIYLKTNPLVNLIFFTESWLNPKISDSMIAIDGFSTMRSDRINSTGGGIALFFKSNCNIKQVSVSTSNFPTPFIFNFEFLCVDYFCGNTSMRFICFYVPPKHATCINTIKTVCSVISCLCNPDKPCYVLGDFNLPKINWNIPLSHGGLSHDCFVDFCVTQNWYQQILTPTHNKLNILDLVLCNYNGKNSLISTAVNPPLTTTCDHNLISLSFKSKSINSTSNFQRYPNFKQANYNIICDELSQINWTPTSPFTFQDYYNNFISIITSSINKHVPKYTTKKKNNKLPKHIKLLLNNKLKLYRKYKLDKFK